MNKILKEYLDSCPNLEFDKILKEEINLEQFKYVLKKRIKVLKSMVTEEKINSIKTLLNGLEGYDDKTVPGFSFYKKDLMVKTLILNSSKTKIIGLIDYPEPIKQ